MKKINTRNTLLTAYMGYIRADQRQLVALKSIARLLPRSGITPIFYITPVDYQIGESFFPNRFRERLERNSAVIRRELAVPGAIVLDLTTALDTQAFAWRQVVYPNEHLSRGGAVVCSEATLPADHDRDGIPGCFGERRKNPRPHKDKYSKAGCPSKLYRDGGSACRPGVFLPNWIDSCGHHWMQARHCSQSMLPDRPAFLQGDVPGRADLDADAAGVAFVVAPEILVHLVAPA